MPSRRPGSTELWSRPTRGILHVNALHRSVRERVRCWLTNACFKWVDDLATRDVARTRSAAKMRSSLDDMQNRRAPENCPAL